MNARILLLGVGIAVGYVFGARAGRERYDAMKARVTGVWEHPRVARARHDVVDYAREQAPVIRERAERVAKAAPGFVADSARDIAGTVTSTAKNVAGSVTSTAKDVAGRVGDVASDVRDQAVKTAGDVRERAAKVTEDLRDRGEALVGDVARTIGEARDELLDDEPDDDEAAATRRQSGA